MRCLLIIPLIFSSTLCELKFASVVYRHGDRAPSYIYPKYPHPMSVWPNGLGALTDLGKNQSVELGKYVRNRYWNFLPETYSKEDIYILSSDYERTIRSARLVLDGLYEFGNPTIHVLPFEDNYLYNNLTICPKFQKLMNDMFMANSKKINWILDTLEKMSQYTGIHPADNTFLSLRYIWRIHDCLLAEETHGLELPEWSRKYYPQPLREITHWLNKMYTLEKPMKRLRCGPLLKNIIENFEKVINGTLQVKIWQYSGHDITIVGLLHCLEIFDGDLVPPSSSVFLELFKTDNDHEVLITYKKNYLITELKIPNCTLRCPFEKFKYLHGDLLPGDWKSECNFSSSLTFRHNYIYAVIFVLITYNCHAIIH